MGGQQGFQGVLRLVLPITSEEEEIKKDPKILEINGVQAVESGLQLLE